MDKSSTKCIIPDETIVQKIFLIRGKKVMIDKDLAQLFNVETRRLKEQVRRNIYRFPEDFMFELSNEELESLRAQFGKSSKEIMGLRIPPFAFTEHGVIMLASVLKSKTAIQVNIQIVRIFIKLREFLKSQKELLKRLENLENKVVALDNQFLHFLSYLKNLEKSKKQLSQQSSRNRIGYRRRNEL